MAISKSGATGVLLSTKLMADVTRGYLDNPDNVGAMNRLLRVMAGGVILGTQQYERQQILAMIEQELAAGYGAETTAVLLALQAWLTGRPFLAGAGNTQDE